MIRLVRVIVFDLPSIEVHQNGELQFAGSDRDEIAAELSRRYLIENPMQLVDAALIYGDKTPHTVPSGQPRIVRLYPQPHAEIRLFDFRRNRRDMREEEARRDRCSAN